VKPHLTAFGDVFELRVALRHIRPTIWRSLRVPVELTLAQLHQIFQIAMGWQESHLHDFLVNGIRFGMVDVEDEIFSVDEDAAPVGAVASVGSTFLYRYDFGDDWEHEVRIEGVVEGADETILCTGGSRACPPEDCGGAPGYAQLLKVLANPKHEEYADTKRWVGRAFDPERFDVAAVNRKLKPLARRFGRGRT